MSAKTDNVDLTNLIHLQDDRRRIAQLLWKTDMQQPGRRSASPLPRLDHPHLDLHRRRRVLVRSSFDSATAGSSARCACW